MGLDIRTISLFVGVLSAVQAVSIFVFSWTVGAQPGARQYAYGNAGFSLGFILMLLRGVIPDFYSIVIANTAISLGSYILFDGVCAYTYRDTNRKPFLLIPGAIFLSFIYLTHIDNDMSIRIFLISATSALFSLLCSFYLFKLDEKGLQQSSRFTASILLFYGVFLAARSVLVVVYPVPENIFVNEDLQVFSFLLTALCGLLWSIGFATMMAQRLMLQIRQVAVTDYLTGVLNRKAGQESIQHVIDETGKEQSRFSILLIDIDHFKTVNDVYGHAAGDVALKKIAEVLKTNLRSRDTLARWGGEEFLIVLPGVGRREALVIAERTRRRVAETRIPYKEWRIKCTISIGIAGNWDGYLEIDEVLARADRSLYAAKDGGRNRIVVFGQPSPVPSDAEDW